MLTNSVHFTQTGPNAPDSGQSTSKIEKGTLEHSSGAESSNSHDDGDAEDSDSSDSKDVGSSM